MEPSDERCVQQCLNGHADEYRLLVRRYERPIVSYLQSRMGDADAAAEAAQEAFVRAYFRLDRLKRGAAFFPWLVSIAHRVMLEAFRRRRRTTSLAAAGELVAPATDDMPNDEGLAKAVARLPAVYREATILRYFGGLSCAEVGERLDVPLGTVTKRLSRAYALLREALAPADANANEVRR